MLVLWGIVEEVIHSLRAIPGQAVLGYFVKFQMLLWLNVAIQTYNSHEKFFFILCRLKAQTQIIFIHEVNKNLV